jgi:UDP-N-acetylglucosamine 3-dehydrogenase
MTIQIGLLGAGFMGSTHARALAAIDDVEIVGIYGQSEKRAKPLADELGTTWTTDLERLIDNPAVEAIDICLPGPQHRTVTEMAIAAGKHVLLEKPITLLAEDADALVDLAARTDRVFMVAHVLRFWPEYVELQRLATSGDFGKPVQAIAYRRQAFPAWSSLFSQSELTGGAVIDMMIHDYDALNWIFGQPKSVVARGIQNPRSGGYDQVQVMIEYGSGWAQVDGGMMMPESYPFTSSLQVLCETGALEYNFQAGGRSVEMGTGRNDLRVFPNEGDPHQATVEQADPYAAEIAYWVECLRTGSPATRATPAAARTALRTALAARRSLDNQGLVAETV